MKTYDIRVYHDETKRCVRFDGWQFPDKEQAREFGMQQGTTIYGNHRGISVWVAFINPLKACSHTMEMDVPFQGV